jgi:hypothetical protein
MSISEILVLPLMMGSFYQDAKGEFEKECRKEMENGGEKIPRLVSVGVSTVGMAPVHITSLVMARFKAGAFFLEEAFITINFSLRRHYLIHCSDAITINFSLRHYIAPTQRNCKINKPMNFF